MKRDVWLLTAFFILIAGTASVTLLARGRGAKVELTEEQFVQQYPDALIYEGLALYDRKDFSAAVAVWEKYLHLVPKGTDWVSVPELIKQAQEKMHRSDR